MMSDKEMTRERERVEVVVPLGESITMINYFVVLNYSSGAIRAGGGGEKGGGEGGYIRRPTPAPTISQCWCPSLPAHHGRPQGTKLFSSLEWCQTLFTHHIRTSLYPLYVYHAETHSHIHPNSLEQWLDIIS